MWVVFSAFVVALVVIGGNIAIDPTTAMSVVFVKVLICSDLSYLFPCRYFAVYFLAVLVLFSATQNKTRLLRWFYWAYDQNPILHKWSLTRKWGDKLIKMMARLKRQPVCILAKSDEVIMGSICAQEGGRLTHFCFRAVLDTSFISDDPVCSAK